MLSFNLFLIINFLKVESILYFCKNFFTELLFDRNHEFRKTVVLLNASFKMKQARKGIKKNKEK